MRLPMALPLAALGTIMLFSAWMLVGVGLIWAAWWIYERSGWSSGEDGMTAAIGVAAGLGVLSAFVGHVLR